MSAAITRAEAEEFLVREAHLLDDWQLERWLELFEPGARYLVPSTDDPEGSPEGSLFLIADDWEQLRYRVVRLNNRHAHNEHPRSRTRRLVSTVQVERADPADGLVRAAFALYRTRRERTDLYVGHYVHRVRRDERGGLRFTERKAVLDTYGLRPVGVIGVIV